jgi:hypothetical protein
VREARSPEVSIGKIDKRMSLRMGERLWKAGGNWREGLEHFHGWCKKTPCPILFTFFVKRVGNHETHPIGKVKDEY